MVRSLVTRSTLGTEIPLTQAPAGKDARIFFLEKELSALRDGPMSAWGEEPWFLNPHTEVGEMDAALGPLNSSSPLEAIARRHERPGALFADDAAVAAFTAESVRVARYRTLVADAKGETALHRAVFLGHSHLLGCG